MFRNGVDGVVVVRGVAGLQVVVGITCKVVRKWCGVFNPESFTP